LRPRASETQMRRGPLHDASNAMRAPSGDQAGLNAFSIRRVSLPLSSSSEKTSPRMSVYRPNTSAGSNRAPASNARTKSSERPSGAQAGWMSSQSPRVDQNNQIQPNNTHGIKTISIGYISPGDKPLVMRGPMLHQIIRQFLQQVNWGELDYLIVDLPPGTGDVVISLVQTVPLTGAVVVSTPSDVSLQDARKALEMFGQVNVEVLGIVENMSHFTCPHCHEVIDIFSKGGAERTAAQFKVPFLGSIELIPAIREGGDKGLPVALAGPKSPQATEFFNVAQKLMERADAAAASASDVIEIS